MKILNTKDGLSLSELSLGCMNLPIDDKAEAEKIIEAALDAGINYFDTADLYQFGENEKMVGEILDKYRSRYDFLIGTNVGNQFDAAKQEKTAWNPTAPYIKEAVKVSLHQIVCRPSDQKSTLLNSSHVSISFACICLINKKY